MSGETHSYIPLARILRPRGTKGEVAAEILTDFPERLTKLTEVFLHDGKAAPRRIAVKTCWLSQSRGGQAIFHFEGCDSVDAAEKLRGFEVQVPLAQCAFGTPDDFAGRVALPTGSYYVADLIGCSVFEIPPANSAVSSSPCSMASVPALLGVVRDVQFTGARGTPLLVVESSRGLPRSHRGELLIPLAEDICTRIDVAAHRIEVVLPEGLRELNSPS